MMNRALNAVFDTQDGDATTTSMRRLDDQELAATRDVLTGDFGGQIIDTVFALVLGRKASPPPEIWEKLEALGWIERGKLTPLGELIADPVREYVFWLGRDRKLHHHDELPQMDPHLYRGKDVLEVGSGGGCNLLSLMDGKLRRLVGIDPMPVYLQLAPILAELAGVEPAEAAEGSGESIPFEAESFDTVFCFTSHQYMDMDRAFTEIARVLRPQGELLISGETWLPFVLNTLERLVTKRTLRGAKYAAVTAFNTLTYQALGRRIIRGKASNTTAYPIYPSLGFLRRRLRDAGLQLVDSRNVSLHKRGMLVVARKR
jgi:ubiquinone/menaquinone biosynthesis C-methylase UbiE